MEKKNCSCEAEKEERGVKRGKMEKKKKVVVFVRRNWKVVSEAKEQGRSQEKI